MKKGEKTGEYPLMVRLVDPREGQRIYDPCCGSGGMFVQSEKFIEAHGGKIGDVSIYGQESNPTTWRLAAMNLAIRGIDYNLGREPNDTFTKNQHPDLRADFILANPRVRARGRDDPRRWASRASAARRCARPAWSRRPCRRPASHPPAGTR